jgi:hypothetical protein
MKNLIIILILIFAFPAFAESYIYIEQTKNINGDFTYRMPKLELNKQKLSGDFFGKDCFYLSEFELGLVYTAPRAKMFALNHETIEIEWHMGIEVKPFWVSYSLGAVHWVMGNSAGLPEGVEMKNTARLGMTF